MVLKIDSSSFPSAIKIPIGYIQLSEIRYFNENYSIQPEIERITSEIRSKVTKNNLKDHPIIKYYRDFYWDILNIDPTKIRPSNEALIRRITRNNTIPKISPLVDAYNWASIESFISMGAYDLDTLTLPISISAIAEPRTFFSIGNQEKTLDPGTIVVQDSKLQVLCQFPYRDAEATKITCQTENAIILLYGVPGVKSSIMENAMRILVRLLENLQHNKIVSFKKSEPIQLS